MKNLSQAVKKIDDINYQELIFYPLDDLRHTIRRETSIKVRTKQLVSVMTPVFLLSACGGSGSGLKKPNSNNSSSDNSNSNNSSSKNASSDNSSSDNSSSDNSNSNTSNADNSSSDNSSSDNSNSNTSNADNSSSDNQQASNNQSNTHNSNTSITKEEAARFLLQAQFSSTMDEIQHVQNIGYEAWIDEQLAMPILSANTATEWLKQNMSDTYLRNEQNPKTAERMMWKQLITCEDTLRKRMALALSEIYVVTVKHMPFPYRAACAASYWDMLNRHAFGNIRNLLHDVSRHFAMGDFLDIVNSKKTFKAGLNQPDENFARELMQLMTIGLVKLNIDGSEKKQQTNEGLKSIETYDLQTVKEVAKVFTGYLAPRGGHIKRDPTFDRFDEPMFARPIVHDFNKKNIFGHVFPATPKDQQNEESMLVELNKVLDILFYHDNIAPFLTKQFIQRFVTSNPSPAYIARVAKVFNNNGNGVKGDIGATIKAILLDREAREVVEPTDPRFATRGKAREPMIMFCQWARTFTNKTSVSGSWETFVMGSRFGQTPLYADTIFNFFRPGDAPLDKAFSQNKKVAPDLYLVDTVSIKDYSNFMHLIVQRGIYHSDGKNIEVPIILDNLTNMLPKTRTPNEWTTNLVGENQIIDYLNLFMCAGTMQKDTKQDILDAMKLIKPRSHPYRDADSAVNIERVKLALWMTLICPEFRVQK